MPRAALPAFLAVALVGGGCDRLLAFGSPGRDRSEETRPDLGDSDGEMRVEARPAEARSPEARPPEASTGCGSTACLIEGVCYPAGPKPGTGTAPKCSLLCEPALSPSRWSPAKGCVITLAGDGTAGFRDGLLSTSRLNQPLDVAVDDSGRVYVTEGGNRSVRVIEGSSISTMAGGPTSSDLVRPAGLTVDPGGNRLLIADQSYTPTPDGWIREIVGGKLNLTPIAAKLANPADVSLTPAGLIHFADRDSHTIKLINPSVGSLSIAAGAAGSSGCVDGGLDAARLNKPTGVAVAPDGVIYVADYLNHRVRKIDLAKKGNEVSTLGKACTAPVAGGFSDGPMASAEFNRPESVAFGTAMPYLGGAAHVLVADGQNHCVRVIVPSDGMVARMAGTRSAGFRDGDALLEAQFNLPAGIALGKDGLVYIADYSNNRIRVFRFP